MKENHFTSLTVLQYYRCQSHLPVVARILELIEDLHWPKCEPNWAQLHMLLSSRLLPYRQDWAGACGSQSISNSSAYSREGNQIGGGSIRWFLGDKLQFCAQQARVLDRIPVESQKEADFSFEQVVIQRGEPPCNSHHAEQLITIRWFQSHSRKTLALRKIFWVKYWRVC